MAGPLEWATDMLIGLVGHASNWPGSNIELSQPPSVWWVAGALIELASAPTD